MSVISADRPSREAVCTTTRASRRPTSVDSTAVPRATVALFLMASVHKGSWSASEYQLVVKPWGGQDSVWDWLNDSGTMTTSGSRSSTSTTAVAIQSSTVVAEKRNGSRSTVPLPLLPPAPTKVPI